MDKKIGFACKFMNPDRSLATKVLKEIEGQYNSNVTTISWLSRQTIDTAEEKIWDISIENAKKTFNLVKYVSELPVGLRMVRISSDQCPAYTHPDWNYFYKKPDVLNKLEILWKKVGDLAREKSVRLSFHPGQFTVLASDSPTVVENSIKEFEYHCDMIRWMGYGQKFQDMKCNVHIGGKRGPDGIRVVYPRLSTEAKNTITIENDEFGWGLESCLELSDIIPIVLDIHHHYIRTEGEYILSNDDRIEKIIDSWRGVRPTMHYSISREEYIKDHKALPDMKELLNEGHKKTKLRAHSDMLTNRACNDWALSFWNDFDIMVEAKHKNLASISLYNYAKTINSNVN